MVNLHDLELKISHLLRIGVLIAGVVITVGWLWGLLVNHDDLFKFTEYHAESLVESLRACSRTGNTATLVTYAGLALLVGLPPLRVLLTGVLFLVRREFILGWTAVAVFTVLVTSFWLGTSV